MFFEIFKIFFIIGIQLLGGGYVIVPLLKKYLVEERKWLSEEELIDFFALSQCMPGIIAGNVAICAGYKVKGTMGAIAAILGIITPCFIFIIILAQILTGIVDLPIVQSIFKGIRISVLVLIMLTIKELWSKSINSVFGYILFILILTALFVLPVSPSVIIILTVLGAFLYGKAGRIKNA